MSLRVEYRPQDYDEGWISARRGGGFGRFDRRTALLAFAFLLSLGVVGSPFGFVWLIAPPMTLVLVATIVTEGLLMAGAAGLRRRSALVLSFWVNLGVVWFGFILAPGLTFILSSLNEFSNVSLETRRGVTMLLLPYLFLSWALKYEVFTRRAGRPRPAKIFRATGLTTVVSYAAMLTLVWTTSNFYSHPRFDLQVHTAGALNEAEGLKTAVAEFRWNDGRYPDHLSEIGFANQDAIDTRYARMSLGRQGRIDLDLQMPDEPRIHGKRITLTPKDMGPRGDEGVEWICTAQPEIARFAPVYCRK